MTTAPPSPALDTATFREAVRADLRIELARRTAALEPLGAEVTGWAERIGQYLHGGKMLRPLFCLWGARAVDAEPDAAVLERVVAAGAAIELLQAAALLHDDVIDDSPTRRGRPAMHIALAADHADRSRRGDADAFGRSAAVLLGDLTLMWSRDRFVQVTGVGSAAAAVVERMCTEVTAGQFLDLLDQAGGVDGDDVGTALRVIRYKTVSYTVLYPLQLGSALAGGSARTAAALEAVASPLGTAFQLRDDVLGVFGDETVTGKSVSSDLVEGKRTVLLARTRALSGDAGASVLDEVVGNASASATDMDRVRELMRGSGALDEIEQRIADEAAAAHAAVDDGAFTAPATQALHELVESCVQRTG